MFEWVKSLFGGPATNTATCSQSANVEPTRTPVEKAPVPAERRKAPESPHEDHKTRIFRLADENTHLIREICALVGSDGGFGSADRIRAIGEELYAIGGDDLMQCAYYGVRNSGRYFSQDIWDGIGSWRS